MNSHEKISIEFYGGPMDGRHEWHQADTSQVLVTIHCGHVHSPNGIGRIEKHLYKDSYRLTKENRRLFVWSGFNYTECPQ